MNELTINRSFDFLAMEVIVELGLCFNVVHVHLYNQALSIGAGIAIL